MPRVTIDDVAREAEVSTMTVSRVVNNKGEISKETREKVEKAIARLGYRPNRLARALTLQETQTIGIVVPDISNPFFADIIQGAEDEAWRYGYSLLMSTTVENLDRETRTLQLLEERNVDGVIVCSARLPEEKLFELIKRQRAALLINRTAPDSIAGTLQIDDTHGAMRAVHHLLSRGREKIAMLAGPESSYSRRRRIAGYTTALETTGREVNEAYIVTCQPDETGGYQAAKELLAKHPELEGVFCHNDLIAIGLLQACRELGIRVPDDLAVVGCDNIRMASLVTPSLTTLGVDKQALGRRAVNLLLERMNQTSNEMTIVQKPELVVRESAP